MLEAVTVGAEGLEVGEGIVGMIAVDMVDIDLAGVFRNEATAHAGGGWAVGTQECSAMR
jgi:hypothetical protein